MSLLTVDDLNQRLLSLELLDMGKIRDVENAFGARDFTSEEFLQEAQRRGYLTKYQVERLTSGESTGFYYGDYRIQYLVGSGSFARVFRCVHKTTGKVVAVKVLRARFRDDEVANDEFVREAELGMELRHPNIAAVYEQEQTKYDRYMVMDFIEGRTLREEVNAQKNGRVEPKRATRIVTDVCSALDYAAKRGYQHRDMKLSNIMLSSSGKAVLLDFGLLADENSKTKTQRAIEYAALERTTRVRRDDKRSDLYFLGAIYYQLLTGIAPLGEIKERAKRLDSARFRNVKPIREVAPYVPRAVAFVVDKAMKLVPEERYQSPGAMLADLEVAAKKLESGVDEEVGEQTSLAAAHAREKRPVERANVLIVEANPTLQDAFREAFKAAGFRALVISNVARAMERFDDPERPIGAALFNAQSLGKAAVEAFNKLADSPSTKDVPAILLLDENQVRWAAKAKRSKTRLAVGMPITMKRLILVVVKLTTPKAPESETPKTPDVGASTAELTKDASQTSSSESYFKLGGASGAGGAVESDEPTGNEKSAANVAAKPTSTVPTDSDEPNGGDPEDDFPVEAFDAALDRVVAKFEVQKRKSDAEKQTDAAESPESAESNAPTNAVERENFDDSADDDYYADYEDDADAENGEK